MPRGGRRPGAGRKPKPVHLRMLDGGASKRATPQAPKAEAKTEAPSGGTWDAPADLTEAERAVWSRQAPFAVKNGTLTAATAMAFENLCRNAALEREVALGEDRGSSKHKGLMQMVSADFLAFNLKPCGKRMPEAVDETPAAPVNPLARFLKRHQG